MGNLNFNSFLLIKSFFEIEIFVSFPLKFILLIFLTSFISNVTITISLEVYSSIASEQLKNNRLSFDAIIDLHGKTEVQAYESIKNFIKDCYFNNLKSIMIVTGKGSNSKGKLKLKTPLWLKSDGISKYVVGFDIMPHNKGGEGALFVQLKNKNKYKL